VILIGGGVTSRAELLLLVRRKVAALLNGYLSASPAISLPELGSRAGVLGAIALAQRDGADASARGRHAM